jgi:multidrug efflux pump subunit AcrA (membrane-fusion protein)
VEKLTKFYISAGILIAVCIGCLVFYDFQGITGAAAQGDSSKEAVKKTSVAVTQAKKITFEEVVATSGNVETKNYALVSNRIPGIIDEIFVREGDHVVAGKTRLFQIDKIKVTQAVEIAKQSVALAEAGVKARKATVERVQADFEKAQTDYERYKRLYQNDEAVTQNAFESQESRFKQLKAALDEAKAAAELSQSQLEQARGSLIIASKDLADSLVTAPISGYISIRYREPGEMAGSGASVVRIDDTSTLEISAYLPAEYYARVSTGTTNMAVTIDGIGAGELPLSYKSPTIDNKLRNFEIKSILTNPPRGVTSGAMAKIKVVMARRDAVGVPRQSIIPKADGNVIFLADQDKAKMIKVEKGLETDGWAEVRSNNIKEGQSIISMGQDRLKDGESISITKEAAK